MCQVGAQCFHPAPGSISSMGRCRAVVLTLSARAPLQTRFQIDVAYNYRNINLIAAEQDALRSIWDQCCDASVNTTTRAFVNEGNGERVVNPVVDNRHELMCTACDSIFDTDVAATAPTPARAWPLGTRRALFRQSKDVPETRICLK